MLDLGPHEDEDGQDEDPASVEAGACTEGGTPMSEGAREGRAPNPKSAKRRKLRKKVTRNKGRLAKGDAHGHLRK